jgi:chorismate mutase
MRTLTALRSEIDRLDVRLVELLNARAACAAEIGRHKAEQALSVEDPAREQDVLSAVLARNAGPLSRAALARIYTAIMDGCKETQQPGAERHDV